LPTGAKKAAAGKIESRMDTDQPGGGFQTAAGSMTPRHFRTRTGQGGDTSLFIARKRRRRSALPLQSKTASQRACGLDKEAAGREKRPRGVALPAAGIGGHAVGLEERVSESKVPLPRSGNGM
jgi:hypothetical protein